MILKLSAFESGCSYCKYVFTWKALCMCFRGKKQSLVKTLLPFLNSSKECSLYAYNYNVQILNIQILNTSFLYLELNIQILNTSYTPSLYKLASTSVVCPLIRLQIGSSKNKYLTSSYLKKLKSKLQRCPKLLIKKIKTLNLIRL